VSFFPKQPQKNYFVPSTPPFVRFLVTAMCFCLITHRFQSCSWRFVDPPLFDTFCYQSQTIVKKLLTPRAIGATASPRTPVCATNSGIAGPFLFFRFKYRCITYIPFVMSPLLPPQLNTFFFFPFGIVPFPQRHSPGWTDLQLFALRIFISVLFCFLAPHLFFSQVSLRSWQSQPRKLFRMALF